MTRKQRVPVRVDGELLAAAHERNDCHTARETVERALRVYVVLENTDEILEGERRERRRGGGRP